MMATHLPTVSCGGPPQGRIHGTRTLLVDIPVRPQRQVPWRFWQSPFSGQVPHLVRDRFIDSVEDTPVWHQRPFTPRICSEPPAWTLRPGMCWSRQRCRQFQLRWLMRRPVSKSHSLFTVLTCQLQAHKTMSTSCRKSSMTKWRKCTFLHSVQSSLP